MTQAYHAPTIEAAAKVATGFLVGDPKNGIPLRSPMPHEIADAIRALPVSPVPATKEASEPYWLDEALGRNEADAAGLPAAIKSARFGAVPTPSDAIGETVEKLRELLAPFLRAADKADERAAEAERLGMGRLTDNASSGLGIKFGDLRRVRDTLPTLLTALEQRGDGWLPIESAPISPGNGAPAIWLIVASATGKAIGIACRESDGTWTSDDGTIISPPAAWFPLPSTPLPMKED